MDNDIFEFVNILKDNRYEKKVNEEFDTKFNAKLSESGDCDIEMAFSENSFYVELNGYSDPSDLDKFLLEYFNKFNKVAADSRLDKNKILQNEITQRLFSIRTDLEQLKLVGIDNKFNNYLPLINVKISYCDKTLGFISNIKNEISKLIRKKSGTYTNLTQKQIIILFHHMHKLGYIGKDMDNDEFAELVSEMTDFSSGRIRQDLSIMVGNSTWQ